MLESAVFRWIYLVLHAIHGSLPQKVPDLYPVINAVVRDPFVFLFAQDHGRSAHVGVLVFLLWFLHGVTVAASNGISIKKRVNVIKSSRRINVITCNVLYIN